MGNIDFNELIKKVSKEKCEITISCEPDRAEITIQPWVPFSFSCPINSKENENKEGNNEGM